MKKLQSWGVTSVGVCYMLVGLQICREVIFQVVKGDSLAITSFVYLWSVAKSATKGILNYKIQRGKWTALGSAKIMQRNLIVLSYGRIF